MSLKWFTVRIKIINKYHQCRVSGISILAGTNSLSDGGVSRKVIASYYHENYGNFMNDIALMKLETNLDFSESIRAVDLVIEEIPLGSDVVISGWGKRVYVGSNNRSTKIQFIEIG